MKRTPLILAAATLIAVTSTAVIATAHDRGGRDGRDGMRHDGGGPVMLLERFDTDGDGKITRAEVEGAPAAHFAQTDTNGDGQLSAQELVAAAEAHRAERRADRVERMIEYRDTNGDGLLSLEEMTADHEGRGPERMFDRFDADGDGAITHAELEDIQGKMGHGRWFKQGHGHGHGEGHGHK